MLDLGDFVADCKTALGEGKGAVRDLLARTMSDPSGVIGALGEPTDGAIYPIYKSPELTIVNVVWKPMMTLMPHNHEMWAVIGIYGGREDNIFWKRLPEDVNGRIETAGARALSTGDVCPLGRDVIHSVTNPIPKMTGAIHIYGGDFFEAERSEWDPEKLTEHAYDMSRVRAMFED